MHTGTLFHDLWSLRLTRPSISPLDLCCSPGCWNFPPDPLPMPLKICCSVVFWRYVSVLLECRWVEDRVWLFSHLLAACPRNGPQRISYAIGNGSHYSFPLSLIFSLKSWLNHLKQVIEKVRKSDLWPPQVKHVITSPCLNTLGWLAACWRPTLKGHIRNQGTSKVEVCLKQVLVWLSGQWRWSWSYNMQTVLESRRETRLSSASYGTMISKILAGVPSYWGTGRVIRLVKYWVLTVDVSGRLFCAASSLEPKMQTFQTAEEITSCRSV